MLVVFRVDASSRIGTGHVVRCLTLGDQLSRHGAQCHFIVRAHPGYMDEMIRSRGYAVMLLPAPTPTQQQQPDAIVEGEYVEWLGVSQAQDAAETRHALSGERPDWLIVDHYSLDTEWESEMRPQVGAIAVIDDLANRPHDCELLLDQNYSAQGAARYDGLLPEAAIRLCGPSYALLHPAYAERRPVGESHSGKVERVFVFFGGTDPDNLTGRALTALSAPEFAQWAVDIVVGANNPHRCTLEEQAARRGRTTLHGLRPHLADLMAGADLAIGAGGATTWERCCLGLPSLVASLADNQRPACEALATDGLIAYTGHHDQVTADTIQAALAALVAEPEQVRRMASAGQELVDGRGVERVIDELMGRTE